MRNRIIDSHILNGFPLEEAPRPDNAIKFYGVFGLGKLPKKTFFFGISFPNVGGWGG